MCAWRSRSGGTSRRPSTIRYSVDFLSGTQTTVVLDISLPQWLDEAERDEAESVARERNCLRIAKEVGEKVLPTASLDWDELNISATPPGAMTPGNARETLTTAANRKRWARQKALRSGIDALSRAIRAA